MIMPFIGIQSISPIRNNFVDEAGNFGGGYRLGGLVGGRANRWLSLNAAIAVDFGNDSRGDEGYAGGLTEWLLTFCPLLHLGPDAVQVLVGPKVGLLWGSESNGQSGGYYQESADWYGLTYGAQLGIFFRLVPAVSLGGILSVDWMRPLTGTCDTCDGLRIVGTFPPSHHVESAMLAVLF